MRCAEDLLGCFVFFHSAQHCYLPRFHSFPQDMDPECTDCIILDANMARLCPAARPAPHAVAAVVRQQRSPPCHVMFGLHNSARKRFLDSNLDDR